MNLEYRNLYKSLIADKAKSIIIQYSPCKRTFTYKPLSHKIDKSAIDDLYDLVIDNTVFYAFSEEIVRLHSNMGALDNLKAAAKYSFAERLPKRTNASSDGTIGEIKLITTGGFEIQ